ncbi:MAG: amidohydrolase, partial [Mesorhizobium sp.]|nr:amidohydrolase [Mesorhizobium sp.]
CLLAGSYGEIKSALETCLAKLGPQLRQKAFGTNAARAYRLAIAG